MLTRIRRILGLPNQNPEAIPLLAPTDVEAPAPAPTEIELLTKSMQITERDYKLIEYHAKLEDLMIELYDKTHPLQTDWRNNFGNGLIASLISPLVYAGGYMWFGLMRPYNAKNDDIFNMNMIGLNWLERHFKIEGFSDLCSDAFGSNWNMINGTTNNLNLNYCDNNPYLVELTKPRFDGYVKECLSLYNNFCELQTHSFEMEQEYQNGILGAKISGIAIGFILASLSVYAKRRWDQFDYALDHAGLPLKTALTAESLATFKLIKEKLDPSLNEDDFLYEAVEKLLPLQVETNELVKALNNKERYAIPRRLAFFKATDNAIVRNGKCIVSRDKKGDIVNRKYSGSTFKNITPANVYKKIFDYAGLSEESIELARDLNKVQAEEMENTFKSNLL